MLLHRLRSRGTKVPKQRKRPNPILGGFRQAVDEGEGWTPIPSHAVADRVAFKPETLAALRDGLWLAVNGAGTAGRAR